MKKKAWIVSICCLIAGLVIGLFCGLICGTKMLATALSLLKAGELTESGDRAFQAYQHESRPVAIYALTQDLNTLRDQEDLGNNAYLLSFYPNRNSKAPNV
jgi:hypothetical protein